MHAPPAPFDHAGAADSCSTKCWQLALARCVLAQHQLQATIEQLAVHVPPALARIAG